MSKRGRVSERTLMLFHDSLERCRGSGDLAGRFYERFMAEPMIRMFFVKTNFEHQKRRLTASLYLVVGAAAGTEEGEKHLEHLAEVHAGLGIPPEAYAFWLVSLLEFVAALDPNLATEVEHAWRDGASPRYRGDERQGSGGRPFEDRVKAP